MLRLGRAARDTAAGAGELLFIFDDDDPVLSDQVLAAKECGWRYEVQERLITVPKVNLAAARHVDDYPVLMFLGDDHVPATAGWDGDIVTAIGSLGGTGYAYPWGLGRTDTPEVCAITADVIKALGWFGLPSLQHFYVDNVWADIGNGAGCLAFLPGTILEHMHWTFGKGPRDHINDLAISCTARDEQAYNEWRATQMAADVATVRSLRAIL